MSGPHDPTWVEFLVRAAMALFAAGVFTLFYIAWTYGRGDRD